MYDTQYGFATRYRNDAVTETALKEFAEILAVADATVEDVQARHHIYRNITTDGETCYVDELNPVIMRGETAEQPCGDRDGLKQTAQYLLEDEDRETFYDAYEQAKDAVLAEV